jgi:sulfite reductase (NADPH) flavoprotein alpha-component
MLRRLHSWAGLIAALLAVVLAISGAILSVDPALERLGTTVPADGQLSVAEMTGRLTQHYPDAEQVQRTPSGSVIVYYSRDGQVGADRIDPRSGRGIGPYVSSAFSRWVKELHRSLLASTPGRAVSGITAIIMLVLSVTGVALLAKRSGGWRHLLRAALGSLDQRWHARVGRLAMLGLLLSALTGIYMSATTFGFIPDGMQNEPDFPAAVAGGPAAPISTLAALRATDLNDLRELVYPRPGDPEDFYSLSTAQGDGYVDQATGALLSYQAHDGIRQLYELLYMLHTGEGLWWLVLLLGLCALSVPLMSGTGVSMWWHRRRSMPRITGNKGPQSADTIILVGSESNSTWGFAKALHDALTQAGLRVHTAAMNQLATEYRAAQRILFLTATYGDGNPPGSADQFLARLAKTRSGFKPGFAVLGFGDRQFSQFCQFAKDTEAALLAHGWQQLLELDTIDRQSAQEFARWGNAVGKVMGLELALVHTPKPPRTYAYELIDRVDYGEEVHAPTSILRFTAVKQTPRTSWPGRLFNWDRHPYFEAGDLVGILPPDSTVPRFYSLASASRDGVLEICVRKHSHGLCSRFLHGLQPGERIEAFIQANPSFRPTSSRTSLILVGAGTGIGPLVGFIRSNTSKRPMYLYWGGRDPDSDFLYKPELDKYLADRRLTELHPAFSRVDGGAYVQDRIADDAVQVRQLIQDDAQVLVCGGRAMANYIVGTMDAILAPVNITVKMLKAQGRYREDVF